jgi:rhodanese-related sulfurtransferase
MNLMSAAIPSVSASAVRRALRDRTEIGLLDVRPEGRFAAGHPLFAASFPLGRLEVEVFERLPRRSVPLVVYGDGNDDAAPAVRRLRSLGYRDVSLLDAGLAGWTAAGGELFADVNAPSKAFGELVAATAGTPDVSARDLQAMLRDREDVVVVDARRFEEYQTMSIPTATCLPGAELVLRVGALAPDPATTVVVNCAGRTRSIIGAQSLINAGLANRVLALRNGTIGWTLAGLTLDHGQSRRAPVVPAASARQARADAWAVASRAGVGRIGASELRSLAGGGRRTVYRFDVRTPEEYAAGHPAGFRSAPGGQLVQETDWFAPVRGALVVLADDDGGRAAMTGSWLAQMGVQVAVTPPGPAGPVEAGPWRPARPPLPEVTPIGPAQVDDWLRAGEALVVDIDTSRRFLDGHVPGALWALRADLSGDLASGLLDRTARLVLASADGILAAFAAADLAPRAGAVVAVLDGGTAGWARSGRPLQAGPGEMLSPPVDVYRRPYEGTDVDPAAMQAYLDWEYGLVAQLERDGTHGFIVLSGPPSEGQSSPGRPGPADPVTLPIERRPPCPSSSSALPAPRTGPRPSPKPVPPSSPSICTIWPPRTSSRVSTGCSWPTVPPRPTGSPSRTRC